MINILLSFYFVAAQVAFASVFYLLGQFEAKVHSPACPRPTVTAESCAAVWFGGRAGDMALARQRVCSKGR